jgi:hypothetical protein
MEISMEAHQRAKYRPTYDPGILFLGYTPYLDYKFPFKKDTYTSMFIAALFIIIKL